MYLDTLLTWLLYSGYFFEEMPSCNIELPKKIKINSSGPTSV